MHRSRRRALFVPLAGLAALSACSVLAPSVHANDGIFPPAPAAKSAIDFDDKGFLVHGKRTFLVSAGLEYARIPRALWRDRLLRIKRAGFNTVEIYVFWNFHEPQEGKWNFSDNHDLDGFLKLVNQMGLYATVRVGPYVCAEWDSGGYPVWLRFRPGVSVREDNPAFEGYVDKYFDKVMPIIAANQISKGGSVVLVQLENEHPKGWGTEMPNPYFRHLRDKAVSLGLEVPYFFSGLHHGSDPAGGNPWDSASRTNPWYSTEFWCEWYDKYGNPSPRDTTFEDRATWKILAYGGNGYNYYMLHGGTNFDHFNNNEDASSYDYGAAIGQGGDLRDVYYKFKRAASFATSFADILENSTNATDQYQGAATNPAIRVTARTSPAGTILFLDNSGKTAVETRVKLPGGTELPAAVGATIRLQAGEIAPIVLDYKIAPGITLKECAARVLGIVQQGDCTTLVVYGPESTAGSLRFHTAGGDGPMTLRFDRNTTEIQTFTLNGKTVRVLELTGEQADHTFFVASGGQNYVISGVPYVGDVTGSGATLRLTAEAPVPAKWPASNPPIVYGSGKDAITLAALPVPAVLRPLPTLTGWQTRTAADEARPSFDDKTWKGSDSPLAMGADGDDGAYAWYRSAVSVANPGAYTFTVGSARDQMMVFVDGARVPQAGVKGNLANIELAAGKHSLAVFTSQDGRDKLFGLIGPIDTVDAKGLTGPAALRQLGGAATPLAGWRYQRAGAKHGTPPSSADAGWLPATVGADVFEKKAGFAWYQTTLPALPAGQGGGVLHFESVDDKGVIFVNGKKLAQHSGWNESFDVPLTAIPPAPAGRPNVLSVLVENTDNTGGLSGPVTLTSYIFDAPITGWKMRGGVADPNAATGWQPLPATIAAADGPRLYRATFTAAPPAATGTHSILRATWTGLSRGFMYLNGHNLGRYPDKVAVDGIYLPEAYLLPGGNTLTLLDEQGNSPAGVEIVTEEAATRSVREFVPASKTAAR
jgi:beta-galactosidase